MEYVYGALLLHKLGKEVNEENLNKILHASGAHIEESKVKSLVVSLKDIDIDKELENAIIASAAPVAGVSKEEKPTEEKEEKIEAAAEGLSALFG